MVVKAVAMAGVVAMVVLVLVLIAPHVQSLKPIAQSLDLIEIVNHTVIQYQVINHTVVETIVKYVNKTVPVYINRTVYVYVNKTVYVPEPVPTPTLPEYYGYCSGRIVVLPNGTGWLVLFMLMNPRQYTQYWLEGLGPALYANTTTHYAQFVTALWPVDIVFPTQNYTQLYLENGLFCVTDNYTVNGYWPAVCGDVGGGGPITLRGSGVGVRVTNQSVEFTFFTMATGTESQTLTLNRTYGAVLLTSPATLTQGSLSPADSMYIPCQITITYAPSPTEALWLPVTPNATLIEYWREADTWVFGWYDPNDWTMGYWVWNTPS